MLELIARQPTPTYLQFAIKQVLGRRTNKDKDYNRLYMRVYRLLKKLELQGAVKLFKADGLLVVVPSRSLLNLAATMRVDLMDGGCKTQTRGAARKTGSQTCKIAPAVTKREPARPLYPRRCSPERLEAIRVALSVKTLKGEPLKTIVGLFEDYLLECDTKKIVLRRRHDAPEDNPQFVVLDYRNRFNSPSYYMKQKANLREIFRIASQRYQYGVFLTLTTDPKRFPSIYHSWKHFHVSWNRFMSYISRRLGKKHGTKSFRPMYVAAYEFMDNGLLHVHVVLFGIKWLARKHRITRIWMRCGQGMVNYVTAIVNRGGRWVPMSGKEGKKFKDAQDYLSKYIGKALSKTEKLALYWVSNKRFISWSLRLYRPEAVKVSQGLYEFFGVYYEWDLPCVVTGNCWVPSWLAPGPPAAEWSP